jgi:excisionase family DNA binding protein
MTPNTELEPLATIDDVCTWLQKSKPLVKKLAREGRIPAIKIGKTWRFRKSALADWIKA